MGTYCSFGGNGAFLAAGGPGVPHGLIVRAIQGCVRLSIFEGGVPDMCSALPGAGIQRRYLRAVAKRDDIRIIWEYWLRNGNDPKYVPASMRVKVTFVSQSGTETGVSFPGNPGKFPRKRLKEKESIYSPYPPQRKRRERTSARTNGGMDLPCACAEKVFRAFHKRTARRAKRPPRAIWRRGSLELAGQRSYTVSPLTSVWVTCERASSGWPS